MSLADVGMWTGESALPPLKGAVVTTSDRQEQDTFAPAWDRCRRDSMDDVLFLRLGQGTAAGAGCGHARSLVPYGPWHAGDDALDAITIPETELESAAEAEAEASTRRTHAAAGRRVFLPLSPPVEEWTPLSSSSSSSSSSPQQDVYDAQPPPGYKRLKRVRRGGGGGGRRRGSTLVGFEEDWTIVGTRTVLDRVDRRRHSRPRRSWPREVLRIGDGFSGDETKPRTRKGTSDSKTSSSTHHSGAGHAGAGSHRKKKKSAPSPVLGALEIVSLSQDERAAAVQHGAAHAPAESTATATTTAAAGRSAAAKPKDVRHMMPLRPSAEWSNSHAAEPVWDLGLDEPPPVEEEETEPGEDIVFEVVGEDEDEDDAGSAPALPSLRQSSTQT